MAKGLNEYIMYATRSRINLYGMHCADSVFYITANALGKHCKFSSQRQANQLIPPTLSSWIKRQRLGMD